LGVHLGQGEGRLVGRILERVERIEGYVSESEASLLMATTALALIEREPHAVVEIGSYCGRSTVALGSVVKAVWPEARVYAIDPHQGEVTWLGGEVLLEPPTLVKFRRNLAEAGLTNIVETIQKRSFEVVLDRPIGMLFIDGLHDYLNVSRDFAHFEQWVVAGGYVVFDDYAAAFPGVIAFVDEILGSGRYREVLRARKMIVTQKLLRAVSSADRGLQQEPRGPRTQSVAASGAGPDGAAGQEAAGGEPAELRALKERLGRQERGVAVLWDVLREDIARRETQLGQGECRIVEVQAELHAKVGEANAVIRGLQAELEAKVGERDRTIRGLQAELHAKVGEANEAIGRLQAERDGLRADLAAMRRSRAWRFMRSYDWLRQKLRRVMEHRQS
jgi:predicted O-methyltransferase YrrM